MKKLTQVEWEVESSVVAHLLVVHQKLELDLMVRLHTCGIVLKSGHNLVTNSMGQQAVHNPCTSSSDLVCVCNHTCIDKVVWVEVVV